MSLDRRPGAAWGGRTLSTDGLTTSHNNISTNILIDPGKVNLSGCAGSVDLRCSVAVFRKQEVLNRQKGQLAAASCPFCCCEAVGSGYGR